MSVTPSLPIDVTKWDFYKTPWGKAGRSNLLTKANNKSLTFSLSDPSTVSFDIDGNHPEALLVNELADDLFAYRNNKLMYRGRVTSSSDTVDSSISTVAFSATDYKGLLYRRILTNSIDLLTDNTPREQAEIAWNILSDAQGQSGGDMGITRGSIASTGVARADEWASGTSIGEAIDDLGSREYGFEWSVDESRRFNIHFPLRGRTRSFSAVYGGNVYSFNRTIDPSQYANVVHATGTDALGDPIKVISSLDNNSVADVGKWDRLEASNAKSSTELASSSRGLLALYSALTPSYTLEFLPGTWNPDDCWLGDSIRLVINSGRLTVNEFYRVNTISISDIDNGGESVSITVGQPLMSTVNRLWYYSRRITELERR